MGRNRNAYGGGPIPPEPRDAMLQISGNLTPAQIKNLAATPVQLLPAPGANRTYLLIGMIWRMNFGTIAYAAGADLHAFIGAPADSIDLGKVLDANAPTFGISATFFTTPGAVDTNQAVAAAENQPMMLSTAGPEFTTGDGELHYTLFYAVGVQV